MLVIKRNWAFALGTLFLSTSLMLLTFLSAVSRAQDGPTRHRNDKGEMVVTVVFNPEMSKKEKPEKVTLAKGEVLLVKLPARLGTGYGWQVAPNDSSILKLDGEPQTEDMPEENPQKVKARANQTGGEEYQVFRFLPSESGKEVLEMQYRRPFDKESPPRRTFKVDVKIPKPSA